MPAHHVEATDTKPRANLPAELLPIVENYRTCEFLTVSKSGAPIAWPTVSIDNPDGTLTISTSIGLPQKAFNVRRDPRVALLFSDPTASGLTGRPQVLIKGIAQCPDEIVTTVRRPAGLWRRILTRQPDSAVYSTPLMRRLMDFYYMRLLITVTPTEILPLPAADAEQPLPVPAGSADDADPFGTVARRLPDFTSAVLCGFDDGGAPTMIRTRPVLDPTGRSLRFALPPGFSIAAGQGGVLCHSHDEKLGKLRSFVATGAISTADAECTLTLERYVAGAVPLGPIGMIRAIADMRGTARRYLERRGLPRPRVAWDDLTALKAEIKKDRRDTAR